MEGGAMSKKKPEKEPKRKGRPPKLIMPEPIPDTPENIARACMVGPPKAEKEWNYLKPGSGAKVEPE